MLHLAKISVLCPVDESQRVLYYTLLVIIKKYIEKFRKFLTVLNLFQWTVVRLHKSGGIAGWPTLEESYLLDDIYVRAHF